MTNILENVRICLEKVRRKGHQFQIFAGFDGYVDTLVKPVRLIGMNGEMEFFQSIADFGNYINQKAGRSCSIELHKIAEKLGGNVAIYASAMSNLGMSAKCVGAFGYPEIREMFLQAGENVELISISNPGCCMALEFSDGKVMLSENGGINDIDYQLLVDRIGEERLYRLLYESDMISLMNWSEVPGCTDIWRGIIDHILPRLPRDTRKKMFIDISDCSRRSQEDIQMMVNLMDEFADDCDITLSLNKNEFEIICSVLNIKIKAEDIETAGEELLHVCALKYLVVHLVNGSYAFTKNTSCFSPNRHVKNPLISTGGGDNFNAGLTFGIMLGMDIQSAMVVANAASGYYVTHAKSACLDDLIEFINQWQVEKEA